KEGDPFGVVLSNNNFLGASEIEAMRAVPELVFVNCCHLGAYDPKLLQSNPKLRYDRAKFASGVADALIKIGVRCVVAAGWAVDDLAARTFATTFYTSILRGIRFIDAVAEARQAIRSNSNNTWAAYQCYGDPDWVFRRNVGDSDAPASTPSDSVTDIASPIGLELALKTNFVQTTYQNYPAKAQLEKLHRLEERFGEKWRHIGFVAE